jgi:hypothetical protein
VGLVDAGFVSPVFDEEAYVTGTLSIIELVKTEAALGPWSMKDSARSTLLYPTLFRKQCKSNLLLECIQFGLQNVIDAKRIRNTWPEDRIIVFSGLWRGQGTVCYKVGSLFGIAADGSHGFLLASRWKFPAS